MSAEEDPPWKKKKCPNCQNLLEAEHHKVVYSKKYTNVECLLLTMEEHWITYEICPKCFDPVSKGNMSKHMKKHSGDGGGGGQTPEQMDT